MAKKQASVEAEVVQGLPPVGESGAEVSVAASPVDDVVDLGGEFLPLPENLEEMLENANKPPLAVGLYLAALVKVEGKHNPVKGSYGYNWEWLVNSSSSLDAWEPTAKAFNVKQYTYIGRLVEGKLNAAQNAFGAAAVLKALQIGGTLNTEAVRGKMVIVEIKHRANPDDPERFFMDVARVMPFTLDGVTAPVLAAARDLPAAQSRQAQADDPSW